MCYYDYVFMHFLMTELYLSITLLSLNVPMLHWDVVIIHVEGKNVMQFNYV